MSDESVAGGTGGSTNRGTYSSRRKFLAGASAGAIALAGCTGDGDDNSGTTGSNPEDVTMLLTPGNPREVRGTYEPIVNMIDGEIDEINLEAEVLQDYSAIRPALTSGQAEIGLDEVTYLSIPDAFDVYGTTVTGGSAFSFSVILKRVDSELNELTQLEGKTVSFADRLSTSGSIYPTYALLQAGLDVGDAPTGSPVDFEGVWSNHQICRKQLAEGEAAAAATSGGWGLQHIPESYASQLPDRVVEMSGWFGTLGSTVESGGPEFRDLWWSEPIPKQPVYARKDWESENKQRIGDLLRSADKELVEQYYPEGYDEQELPFSELRDTSIEDYRPQVERLNALGIELGD